MLLYFLDKVNTVKHFCSSGELIMSNDHILLLAPSENSGTLSQEEIFCFIPFIFFCLLMTNCRRKRVGKSPFLEPRPFPTIGYSFWGGVLSLMEWSPVICPRGAVACQCCWCCWCVLLSKSCPASICSRAVFHLGFTGTSQPHLAWTNPNLLCLDAADCPVAFL